MLGSRSGGQRPECEGGNALRASFYLASIPPARVIKEEWENTDISHVSKGSFISEPLENLNHLNHHWLKYCIYCIKLAGISIYHAQNYTFS